LQVFRNRSEANAVFFVAVVLNKYDRVFLNGAALQAGLKFLNEAGIYMGRSKTLPGNFRQGSARTTPWICNWAFFAAFL